MKSTGVLVALLFSMGAHGQCDEDNLVTQHCLTPAEAAWTCEFAGSTDAGLDQVQMCLDSSMTTSGFIERNERAACIGETVVSARATENVSRCASPAERARRI